MRYIRLYENIDWTEDDFDFEEENENSVDIDYCINKWNGNYYQNKKIIKIDTKKDFMILMNIINEDYSMSFYKSNDDIWDNSNQYTKDFYLIINDSKQLQYIQNVYNNEIIQLIIDNNKIKLIKV